MRSRREVGQRFCKAHLAQNPILGYCMIICCIEKDVGLLLSVFIVFLDNV